MADEFEVAPYQRYVEGLKRGVLLYQHCQACQKAVFYPRSGCPHCGSTTLEFKESARLGTVYSASVVFDKTQNYNLVLVDMDEGFRLMSTLLTCEEPAIGARVKGYVEAIEGQEPRVVFDLVEDA